MQNFSGVGVSPGRIIGTIRQMPKPISEPPSGERLAASTTAEEAATALRAASKTVQSELKRRAEGTQGGAKAVLEATALMAVDPMLIKAAVKLINGGATAERAVWDAGASVAEMLHNLGGYMTERATDVLDVRARIVAELRGVPAPGIPVSGTPFILVAEDLAPADTGTLDPSRVLALVTSGGGPQSHTAIIARALGLPAVVAYPGRARLARERRRDARRRGRPPHGRSKRVRRGDPLSRPTACDGGHRTGRPRQGRPGERPPPAGPRARPNDLR